MELNSVKEVLNPFDGEHVRIAFADLVTLWKVTDKPAKERCEAFGWRGEKIGRAVFYWVPSAYLEEIGLDDLDIDDFDDKGRLLADLNNVRSHSGIKEEISGEVRELISGLRESTEETLEEIRENSRSIPGEVRLLTEENASLKSRNEVLLKNLQTTNMRIKELEIEASKVENLESVIKSQKEALIHVTESIKTIPTLTGAEDMQKELYELKVLVGQLHEAYKRQQFDSDCLRNQMDEPDKLLMLKEHWEKIAILDNETLAKVLTRLINAARLISKVTFKDLLQKPPEQIMADLSQMAGNNPRLDLNPDSEHAHKFLEWLSQKQMDGRIVNLQPDNTVVDLPIRRGGIISRLMGRR